MEGETQLTSLEGGVFVGHGKDFLFSFCNHCGFVFWKRAELHLFRRVQPGGGLSENQKVNEEGSKYGYIANTALLSHVSLLVSVSQA